MRTEGRNLGQVPVEEATLSDVGEVGVGRLEVAVIFAVYDVASVERDEAAVIGVVETQIADVVEQGRLQATR